MRAPNLFLVPSAIPPRYAPVCSKHIKNDTEKWGWGVALLSAQDGPALSAKRSCGVFRGGLVANMRWKSLGAKPTFQGISTTQPCGGVSGRGHHIETAGVKNGQWRMLRKVFGKITEKHDAWNASTSAFDKCLLHSYTLQRTCQNGGPQAQSGPPWPVLWLASCQFCACIGSDQW